MPKFVVETVQIVRQKYYVDVPVAEWAHDALVFHELDPFSQTFFTEDVINTTPVEEFPKAKEDDSVNAATMQFDTETETWKTIVRWDLQ